MDADSSDSLLTSTQRAFLAGETEYEPTDSGGRATRSRMRSRLLVGLKDFELLADARRLDERDVRQLRETIKSEARQFQALKEIVAFIYRLAPDAIELVIEDGIRLGVERFSPGYSVGKVRIPILEHDAVVQKARRKFEDDQPLTDQEIRALLMSTETDANELQSHVRSHPSPHLDYDRRFR